MIKCNFSNPELLQLLEDVNDATEEYVFDLFMSIP